MLPFYFLSITTNLLMGLILVILDKTKKGNQPADNEIKYPILRDSTFLLLLTIFAGFTAISKMLSPVGSDIIILGDFLPVIAGLAGCVVFLGRYLENQSSITNIPDFFNVVKSYDEIIGYVCLVASLVHLLFYKAIFL